MTTEEYNLGIDKYADNLYRFVLSNIKKQAVAEDIVQDVFEKLWVKKELVDASKIKSYLFTAAYHTTIDYLRKEKRIVDIENSTPLENNFSHTNQYSDLKEILNDALNKLSDIQKSVILLRDYEGYSYQEIADITGLNESQVKVYIYRARLFIKKYIGSPEMVV